MDTIYYHKYLKYKTKYKNIIQFGGKQKYDFYFVHGTKDLSGLVSMLKDRVLYPGKDLPSKMRFLGGEENELEDIYVNMNFDDIKNLPYVRGLSIILHPKILYEYGIEFQKGWGRFGKIIIDKNDNKKIKNKKIKEIKNFLRNPSELPVILRQPLYNHQVLINKPIPLDGNLLGIICNGCPQDMYKSIKKALKSYKNVKIYTTSAPPPSIEELDIN